MKTIFFVLLLASTLFAKAQSASGNDYQLLPENLTYFTALRSGKYVNLQWQTQNELATKGFTVERKTNGEWEVVAFVGTSATGGNSSAKESYRFSDANTFKGITQYRVTEVTDNSKQRHSEIRAVKGESQTGKLTVYPNPSYDGKVNIVFDNSNAKDIILNDMAGRVWKQYAGTTDASLTIQNLSPGFYSLHVVDRSTHEIFSEKIIVSK